MRSDLEELVARWRNGAKCERGFYAAAMRECADELDALLRASGNGEIGLSDSQWVNVVNYDNAYAGWAMSEAVHQAVWLTQKYMASNAANGMPAPPAAQRATQAPESARHDD